MEKGVLGGTGEPHGDEVLWGQEQAFLRVLKLLPGPKVRDPTCVPALQRAVLSPKQCRHVASHAHAKVVLECLSLPAWREVVSGFASNLWADRCHCCHASLKGRDLYGGLNT